MSFNFTLMTEDEEQRFHLESLANIDYWNLVSPPDATHHYNNEWYKLELELDIVEGRLCLIGETLYKWGDVFVNDKYIGQWLSCPLGELDYECADKRPFDTSIIFEKDVDNSDVASYDVSIN